MVTGLVVDFAVLFFLAGGVAFLQGVLRFPQRFSMVFRGEFVVIAWWIVVV
ncbi:MAG: hypothetical protein ABSA39_10710 [Edaphobacter sp.]